ncbi:uncharacterized protein BP01DRAFT_16616 [Aspergillus saccharolyticus JOP 1030-1]|uniref:Uncharacterized protein n=1 Tax=Aspergillus saccharolyticus JOP 1030-1 TaxID=1450539 RepID=A0A318ZQ16_9EURO|nr:hypothetical protein BP01DRAFT_16616 [Aspergillus saccharolyticus JOP 1030-1]PYH46513.1 hypothetical protein BP01DRAFT_16616 [Aspergillus saccharolyticus JOP 1030-1]
MPCLFVLFRPLEDVACFVVRSCLCPSMGALAVCTVDTRRLISSCIHGRDVFGHGRSEVRPCLIDNNIYQSNLICCGDIPRAINTNPGKHEYMLLLVTRTGRGGSAILGKAMQLSARIKSIG